MEINEVITAECTDINHEGFGVCKVNGYPIFVFNLLIGEIAKIRIVKLQKTFGYGEVREVLKESPERVKPMCPMFGICGGCEIMHMNYQEQLKHKVRMAEETFKRIGHLNLKVDKILGMDNPYYYRNKVQIPFRMSQNQAVIGFYKRNTHEAVPLDECYIEPEKSTEIAKYVKDLANEYRIQAYDEEKKTGNLRHILIRNTVSHEYMVVLITKEEKILHTEDIVKKIIARYPEVKTIIQNINPKDTNVILGQNSRILYGPGVLIDQLMGLKYKVSHQSFFQTNHVQTEKLYHQVLEYAAPQPDDVIVDGYCGVGTISLILAQHCKQVYGIEIVPEAIRDAKENAKLNGIDNTVFIAGKTEEEIRKLEDFTIDTIVVDPPRKGCDQKLLDAIIDKKIRRMVYVSCDVATLARDLSLLVSVYDVKGVTLVDMFPHISDVETCVLLELK